MALTRAHVTFSLLSALGLVLCGCGPSVDPTEPAVRAGVPQRLRLAVIAPAPTDAYWMAAQAGARRAATEFDLDLDWPTSPTVTTAEEQITLFNTFASSGLKGILLAPLDSSALAPHVRTAAASKVPAVLFGSPLQPTPEATYVHEVVTDERAAGGNAARTLEAFIGGSPAHGGAVLLIRHTADSAATRLREEGFTAELARFPDLKLAAEAFTDGSQDGARRVAASLLEDRVRNNQLTLDGIFASHPTAAEGTALALKALRERGVEITAKTVGFGDSEALLAALQGGELDALVVRDSEKMGYLAVKSLVQHLRGTSVPAYIDAGVKVKTRANLSASSPATRPAASAPERDALELPTHPVGAPMVLD